VPTFWRHEGWGQVSALNDVVHLDYAQKGAGADPGDVFYIRSTDGGVTFGSPVKLNTDTTTRPQWQPNISVSPGGTVFAMWYDGRVPIAGQSQQDAFTDQEPAGGGTPTPTPTATPTPGPITLTGNGRKIGGINTSRLTWSGATSANVDVRRQGAGVIATTPN